MHVFSHGLFDHLRRYFRDQPRCCAYVVVPFINSQMVENMLDGVSPERVVIVTSWRHDHLVSGVSSLETFEVCKKNGWTLYINDRLHAKLYSLDLRSAWIGSANLTMRGLGVSDKPNHELLGFVPELDRKTRAWLHQLIAESRLVTSRLYDWYSDWLGRQEPAPIDSNPEAPPTDVKDPFLVSQLPASDSPLTLWNTVTEASAAADWDAVCAAEHDLALYSMSEWQGDGYEHFRKGLQANFLAHPFVAAFFSDITSDGFGFGRAKQWIHDNCADVPKPYRRDLTQLTQSLYTWFNDLASDVVEVVQPRHSQIIKLKNPTETGSGALCVALWREEIQTLQVDKADGYEKPYKALLLLVTLGRALNGGPNLFEFREIEAMLKELMTQCIPDQRSEPDPRLPFWHLRTARLWKLVHDEQLREELVQGNNRPSLEAMRKLGTGKITPLYWDQLMSHKDRIPQIAQYALREYFEPNQYEHVLTAVGLPA